MPYRTFLGTILILIGHLQSEQMALPERPPVSKTVDNKTDPYLTSVLNHLMSVDQDSSIRFMNQSDPLYGQTLIAIFEEIPGKPPYKLEYKRLIQKDPGQFIPALDQQKILNTVRKDDLQIPFGLAMPLSNYLLGERVIWRIQSKDGHVLKMSTCCPNPAIIKTSAGDLLMDVALISPINPTCYVLFFPAQSLDIGYTFNVGTKQSNGKIPKGDWKMTTFEPVLAGSQGGKSKIELTFKDKSYVLELPWGDQMAKEISKLTR